MLFSVAMCFSSLIPYVVSIKPSVTLSILFPFLLSINLFSDIENCRFVWCYFLMGSDINISAPFYVYGTQCIHISFVAVEFCALDGWMVNISGLTGRNVHWQWTSSMEFTDFIYFISNVQKNIKFKKKYIKSERDGETIRKRMELK